MRSVFYWNFSLLHRNRRLQHYEKKEKGKRVTRSRMVEWGWP